jgi:hypothetical protein
VVVLSQQVLYTVLDLVEHAFGVFPGGSTVVTIILHVCIFTASLE